MSIKAKLDVGLKTAMLAGDKHAVDTLRSLKAAILGAEVTAKVRETGLPELEIQKVVQREVKKRKESIEIYRANDRCDMADDEEKEIGVLLGFLPRQLGDGEVSMVIDEVITSLGGDIGVKDMGRVIGAVKAKVGSSADGATLAKLVKEKLK